MNLPFFQKLQRSNAVLIAGAGGGLDVFCGLPLYGWLRSAGKTVHLANLSFTELGFCDGPRPVSSVMEVTPETSGPSNYFPEVHLSAWLSQTFGKTPVFAIERAGARPVTEAYEWLVQTVRPDTIILVDGGTDSLMRGDEAGLGTPQEDIASLAAVFDVAGVAQKFLVALGFGVDAFHGVCHAHFLENVAAIIAEGGYLGAWSLTQETAEFRFYADACAFVRSRMPGQASIVNASIIDAVSGRFGNHHSTRRTEGSTLFINPLMALYWAFDLEHVARRNLYLHQIRKTFNYRDLSMAIEEYRATCGNIRPWKEIPC